MHFLDFARRQVERHQIPCVRFIQADIDIDDLGIAGFDLAWCRWVASFVSSPEKLLGRMGACLRAGGKAVLHEYQNYSTWQIIPQSQRFGLFVEEIMASWRAAGGEPDIVNKLLPLMDSAGLRVIELRPLISAIGPLHFTWQWPASFIESGSRRLVDIGRITQKHAEEIQAEFRALAQHPGTVMVTPLVIEIIAEKV